MLTAFILIGLAAVLALLLWVAWWGFTERLAPSRPNRRARLQ
jgi:ABC-type transporter Mla subunit MlaD